MYDRGVIAGDAAVRRLAAVDRRLSGERGAGAQVGQVSPPSITRAPRAAHLPPRLSPPPHAGLATRAPCTPSLSPHSREPCAPSSLPLFPTVQFPTLLRPPNSQTLFEAFRREVFNFPTLRNSEVRVKRFEFPRCKRTGRRALLASVESG